MVDGALASVIKLEIVFGFWVLAQVIGMDFGLYWIIVWFCFRFWFWIRSGFGIGVWHLCFMYLDLFFLASKVFFSDVTSPLMSNEACLFSPLNFLSCPLPRKNSL